MNDQSFEFNEATKTSGSSTASFILSFVALLCLTGLFAGSIHSPAIMLPYLCPVIGLVGFVLGYIGLTKDNRPGVENLWQAWYGMAVSAVAVVVDVVALVVMGWF